MSITLYYAPRTRATRPRWLLEELGVPYELVRIDLATGGHKKPEYLAVHPLGVMPALKDGGQTLIESAAICLHLADKYPDKGLAPLPGTPERGEYYQWILFGVATVEPPLGDLFKLQVMTPADKRDPAAIEAAKKKLGAALDVLRKAVAGKEYLVGGRFTVADLMMGSMLSWAKSMELLGGHPELAEYAKRQTGRPAFRKAIAD